ncbi:hypothetical protein [Halodesulfovibrio aestuarii]|uniref:Uncharacterized protein n=1 Tax=Halodesulfovibrio aestuarii TaxID=126333 RepID=A0ABV4JWZ4_9BACT
MVGTNGFIKRVGHDELWAYLFERTGSMGPYRSEDRSLQKHIAEFKGMYGKAPAQRPNPVPSWYGYVFSIKPDCTIQCGWVKKSASTIGSEKIHAALQIASLYYPVDKLPWTKREEGMPQEHGKSLFLVYDNVRRKLLIIAAYIERDSLRYTDGNHFSLFSLQDVVAWTPMTMPFDAVYGLLCKELIYA